MVCYQVLLLDLNGVAPHHCVKVPLIKTFITAHNFDIVYLSEFVKTWPIGFRLAPEASLVFKN